MDKLTPAQRHHTMSRIRSRNTRPEMLVRRYLFAHSFRYRVNVKSLPGTPDIVLRKYRTVIFIHGCFWHGHECLNGKFPQTNQEYWKNKIETNIVRDERVRNDLRRLGWRTMVVWECQLKGKQKEATLNGIVSLLCEALMDKYR